MTFGSTQQASLGDLLERLIDYRGKTPTKSTSGVKLITAKVIKGGRIEGDNHEFIAECDYDTWMRRGLPQQRDILITTEAPLGEVAMLRTPERIALAQRVILLRVNEKIADQGYLYQALRSPLVQGRLYSRATGTTVLGIKQSELVKVEIPLPTLRTQRRIASILSAYDDLIENNTRRIAILEEMARRIYEEWFVRFRFPGHENVRMVESELGLMPKEWSSATLGSVCTYINRGLAPKYDDDAPGIVINQKCIRAQRLSLSAARRQSKAVPKEKLIVAGDVLINSTGVGTLGRVAQVLEPVESCTVDTHVSIVRPSSSIDKDFFGMAMLHKQPHFEAQGVGSTGQTELSRSRIADTGILLPPQALQAQFGNFVSPMRQLAVRLECNNANLRATRDLLLPKLISGELDVSDLPGPEAAAA